MTLERLITQKLLDVVKRVTRDEFMDDNWLRQLAQLSGQSEEQTRVIVLDFLETDVFNVSADNCATFFEPLIESWEVDLETLRTDIVLDPRLAPGPPKTFEFVERETVSPAGEEPGLRAFLQDPSLRGDATAKEIEFLKTLTFAERRPTPLYYYRELQSLRDPLHFEHPSRMIGDDGEAKDTKNAKR